LVEWENGDKEIHPTSSAEKLIEEVERGEFTYSERQAIIFLITKKKNSQNDWTE